MTVRERRGADAAEIPRWAPHWRRRRRESGDEGLPPPSGLARLVARGIVALRWPIVVLWLVGAVVAWTTLPSLQDAQTGSVGDLVPTDADALDAELRAYELFGFPLLSRTVVVQRDPGGISLAEQARVVERAVAVTRGTAPELAAVAAAIPVSNAFGLPPFSLERSTTAITYLFFSPDAGRVTRRLGAERYVAAIEPRFEGFVGATGAVVARGEQFELIKDALPLVELATIALVALAVALHFRALGAPLVNLLAVAVSYVVSIRLIARVGQELEVSVPSEVEPIVVVLLFGVVTDWSIFFLSRFRARLDEGRGSRQAAEEATADLLGIVTAAGLTVVGACAALVVAELGFLQAFGPGMAMSVLVALLVTITLVPALLAIAGAAVYWPRRPRPDPAARASQRTSPEDQGRRARRSAVGFASRHPLLTTVLTCALLLVPASGLLRLELGNPLIRGLPEGSEARRAYVQAGQGFAAGVLSPTVLLLEEPTIARERRELARLQRLLARRPGVARVFGPADSPFGSPQGAALSSTGDAARLAVVLDADPLSSQAIATLAGIERALPAQLGEAGLGGVKWSVAGDTALVRETVTRTREDLLRTAPVALLVVLLVLAVLLRALVAPLYLVAASVLALAASLGLATYLFQELLGYPGLTYYVPFTASVLLVALGSDYNVFLVGRIWQEARRRPLREAVAVAGARAAKPITVAGLVLAGSFALLAIVPLRPFRELAFTVSAGLLVDAFLVRTLLVPALISLVGHRSAWPGRTLRPLRSAAPEA